MKASDVMVSAVVTVAPNASVQQVAELLLRNRISAVPVVDAGNNLVGIVSEGDLINRVESQTRHRASWWLEAITSNEGLAADFIKSHSHKVADVMTRAVITISPEMPVAEVAALLEKNNIKRVPVVKDNHIIGIVSRANLLQALASLKEEPPQVRPNDSAIREQVMKTLADERWAQPTLLTVTVRDGTVDLWGIVESQSERDAIRILAEVTPGVRAVNNNLSVGSPFGYS